MQPDIFAELSKFLPLLIPLFIIQIGLMIAALVDLFKHENTRGPRWMWVLVIVFINIIGPITYFIIGRQDE